MVRHGRIPSGVGGIGTPILAEEVGRVTCLLGRGSGRRKVELTDPLYLLLQRLPVQLGHRELDQELDSALENRECVSERLPLFRLITSHRRRISHGPVRGRRLSGKDWASLSGVVADGNYQIPGFTIQAAETSGLVAMPGNAGFAKGVDRKGIDPSRGLRSGTLR
jgi:hypothetical protein